MSGADRVGDRFRDSRLLYDLCCDVGFSKPQWKHRLALSDIENTCHSSEYQHMGMKSLFSGSTSEGVDADFLGSDKDIMLVVEGTSVIEHGKISLDETDDLYRTIKSDHPAFVRLNLLHTGDTLVRRFLRTSELCEKDENGLLVLNGQTFKSCFRQEHSEFCSVTSQHGPAQSTRIKEGIEIDLVPSLHCRTWPSVSDEWVYRPRRYKWPTPTQIKRITELGCELVPVGNRLSPHRDLEWRLSSSMAEKILIRSFNIVQIQCYFLLKLMLVFLVKPYVKDALCSYHMKNIILHQVENTDPRAWTKDSLSECFHSCLRALLNYLEGGNLPQYFILRQNLFHPKIQGEVRLQLVRKVKEIQSEGWVCLLRCPPFRNVQFGKKMLQLLSSLRALASIAAIPISAQILIKNISSPIMFVEKFTSLVQMKDYKSHLHSNYFPSTACEQALDAYAVCNMSFKLLSILMGGVALRQKEAWCIIRKLQRNFELNSALDKTSARLKLATFYYQTGQVHKCLEAVHSVLTGYSGNTTIICCDPDRLEKHEHYVFERISQLYETLTSDFLSLISQMALPVIFSPDEVTNAPSAIQNIATQRQTTRRAKHSYTRGLITIDPLVYAYYLLTIGYSEIGRPDDSRRSLDNLKNILRNPMSYILYYPEIGQQLLYSLLGHC